MLLQADAQKRVSQTSETPPGKTCRCFCAPGVPLHAKTTLLPACPPPRPSATWRMQENTDQSMAMKQSRSSFLPTVSMTQHCLSFIQQGKLNQAQSR